MTEPISPSVCRNGRGETGRKVKARRTGRGEESGCPPRVARGSACHAWTASSVNQTVKLPRWRRPASYSRQFTTLRFCRGICWRRSWFSLKGTLGIRGQVRGHPVTPARPAAPPAGSVQQRPARGEVTLTEAARMLDLSPMTVLRQIRAGIIPAEQYCKGAPWVIKRQDIENYSEMSIMTWDQGP